jgi:formylglycine-generating enzyme required for sulfatase activity
VKRPSRRSIEYDLIQTNNFLYDRNLWVQLGGSFSDPPTLVRSASRGRNAPSYRLTNLGFRLARTYH